MQDIHFGEQMCEHMEMTGKGRGLPVCVSVCVASMFGKGNSAVMQMGAGWAPCKSGFSAKLTIFVLTC